MNRDRALLRHENVKIKLTRYGYMAYLTDDLYIGRSLDLYGEYCEDLVRIIRKLVKIGAVVVDVGANIGAITLPLAEMVGNHGKVIALEPIPKLFNLLCGNIALNSLYHVTPLRYAAADKRDIVKLKFDQAKNFGTATIVDNGDETAQTILFDDLNLTACDFIKIDVEGYEKEVINGALATIGKFRPLLLLENDRTDKSAALISLLQNLNYKLFWCCSKLFSSDNFFENEQDVFGQLYSVDMLAIPRETLDNTNKFANLQLSGVRGPHDRPF